MVMQWRNFTFCRIGNYFRGGGRVKSTHIMDIKTVNQDVNNNVLGSTAHPESSTSLCTDAGVSTISYGEFLEINGMGNFVGTRIHNN